jgi:hypothetical protein
MQNAQCHGLLIGKVPPIPLHVHQDIIPSASTDQQASLQSNRLLSDEPDFNDFPYDLFQIITHPHPHDPSLADCHVPPHDIFQLPSKIIKKVKHLELNLDDGSEYGDISP